MLLEGCFGACVEVLVDLRLRAARVETLCSGAPTGEAAFVAQAAGMRMERVRGRVCGHEALILFYVVCGFVCLFVMV